MLMRTDIVAVLGSLALATVALAQTADRKTLTLDGATRVIAAAKGAAKARNAPGAVIAVTDDGGNLIALERLDGTFAAGSLVSQGKARTAALFKKPTSAFETLINEGRTAMAGLPPFPDFTPLQGGVPITVGGEVVGAIGVSGAASAAQDEEIAKAGADALAAGAPAPGTVSHFPKADVDAAFAKGAVLLDGSGRNYMVHASRREKPGVVEVHEKDTDVIHVLSGEATFVTGGTVVGAKTVEPDEVRGDDVRGGETRRIAAGDVVVVPAGTPHWFKAVPATMTYYVVKVR
jgi:glc operon protein GlcG